MNISKTQNTAVNEQFKDQTQASKWTFLSQIRHWYWLKCDISVITRFEDCTQKTKLMLSFSFLTTLEPFRRKAANAANHYSLLYTPHRWCLYTCGLLLQQLFFISKGYMQGKGQTLLDTSNYKRVLHNSRDKKLLTLKFSWWYITKNLKNHCQHYLANTNKIHHDSGMCLQMDITQLSWSPGMNRTPPTLHQQFGGCRGSSRGAGSTDILMHHNRRVKREGHEHSFDSKMACYYTVQIFLLLSFSLPEKSFVHTQILWNLKFSTHNFFFLATDQVNRLKHWLGTDNLKQKQTFPFPTCYDNSNE